MHIQDAPRRLRFWRPDAAAKTFTLPAWALIVLTLIAPITIVIVMSFTDYQLGNTEVRWVGLENYSTLVLGDDFLRALKNTVLYAVLTVPTSVFVGLMLALLVNQVKSAVVSIERSSFCLLPPPWSPWPSFGNIFFTTQSVPSTSFCAGSVLQASLSFQVLNGACFRLPSSVFGSSPASTWCFFSRSDRDSFGDSRRRHT